MNVPKPKLDTQLTLSLPPPPLPLLQIPLPAEPTQSRAQATRPQGHCVSGELAQLLREEPQAGHPGHPRATVQRHLAGRRRVRPDVLRAWLSHAGGRRGGALCVHLPLVLWGQVQAVSNQEDHTHVSIKHHSPLSAIVPYLTSLCEGVTILANLTLCVTTLPNLTLCFVLRFVYA